jgi:hypothetical protein
MVQLTSSLIASLLAQNIAEAFTVPTKSRNSNLLTSPPMIHGTVVVARSRDPSILRSSNEAFDAELSEDRKANLFQFLLRDLEVEGVPLLGCDADQAHSLQAALWTTMGELSEKEEEGKACLILENIPVDALRTFVDDFVVLKTQQRLMDSLPELNRFSISLLGKGVGPAIVIETAERSEEDNTKYTAMKESSPAPDELKWTAAMKTFVARMIVGDQVCPYTTSNIAAPSRLEDKGVQPGPIAYRLVGSPDVCDAMSAFWSSVCELLAAPDDQLSSTVMCLPPVAAVAEGSSDATEAHDRFSVVSELISRGLFLYRGEDIFELLHMHPLYDRDLVHPKDKAAHGHLPPTSWLRAMLKASGNEQDAETLTDEQLALQNYQRRSPLPAVVIKRVSQLDATTTPETGMVPLELGDGTIEMASALPTYSRNTIRMVGEGKETLQSALDAEIALTK